MCRDSSIDIIVFLFSNVWKLTTVSTKIYICTENTAHKFNFGTTFVFFKESFNRHAVSLAHTLWNQMNDSKVYDISEWFSVSWINQQNFFWKVWSRQNVKLIYKETTWSFTIWSSTKIYKPVFCGTIFSKLRNDFNCKISLHLKSSEKCRQTKFFKIYFWNFTQNFFES